MKRVVFAATVAIGILVLPMAASGTQTRTGRAAFGSCRAVSVAVSVSARTLHKGQSVTVHATITNSSHQSCTYVGGGSPSPLSIGPCGSLPMQIDNANGRDVWPAHAAYPCPALFDQHLLPGTSVSAEGGWQQEIFPRGTAERGNYRLVVGRVSFPLTLR